MGTAIVLRALNIILVVVFIVAGLYVCSRAQAEPMEQVIARVAALTGLPAATPPKGGFRVVPRDAMPRRHRDNWCYYEIGPERITCREGYAFVLPHEITHHLQKRAGWTFWVPDVLQVAQAQARWVQRNYYTAGPLNEGHGS